MTRHKLLQAFQRAERLHLNLPADEQDIACLGSIDLLRRFFMLQDRYVDAGLRGADREPIAAAIQPVIAEILWRCDGASEEYSIQRDDDSPHDLERGLDYFFDTAGKLVVMDSRGPIITVTRS